MILLQPGSGTAYATRVRALSAMKNFIGLGFERGMVTFPCGRVNGKPVTTARRWISVSARTATADTKPRTGWNQRQQWTSATAQVPTAMRARTWLAVVPGAACMARSVTELPDVGLAGNQPHDDYQHHQNDQYQRDAGAWHAGHDSSSSTCGPRFSNLMPLPSAPSSSTAIP